MRARRDVVKKTYNLPAGLIARMRRHFKVRTETEAVIRAMEEIDFVDEVVRRLRPLSGRLRGYRPLLR